VVQAGQDTGLSQVSIDIARRRDPLPVRHLDRHVAAQLVIIGLVDDAKTPGAQLRRDAVATQKNGRTSFLGRPADPPVDPLQFPNRLLEGLE
jgi:hypothetical protein